VRDFVSGTGVGGICPAPNNHPLQTETPCRGAKRFCGSAKIATKDAKDRKRKTKTAPCNTGRRAHQVHQRDRGGCIASGKGADVLTGTCLQKQKAIGQIIDPMAQLVKF
jgi:hypothetical protein